MFDQAVILSLRGYLPVIYPLLFVGILWLSVKKIDNSFIGFLEIPVIKIAPVNKSELVTRQIYFENVRLPWGRVYMVQMKG